MEYDALVDLYEATNGDKWQWQPIETAGPYWFTTEDPCDSPPWQGLSCSCTSDSDDAFCNIASINLFDYDMSGSLPASLGNLRQLGVLNVGHNLIHSSVPPGLFLASNLTTLRLDRNFFTGTIPEAIANLTQLVELHLEVNNFGGPLPSSIGALTNLEVLDLSDNLISGTLPVGLFDLHNLGNISLNSNNLGGPLPDLFDGLPELAYISLSNNQLNGTLPRSIGALSSMRNFYLEVNNFTGPIPEEFYLMSQVVEVVLGTNAFNGSISASIENLKLMFYMDLSVNYFSGTIPESIARCDSLVNILWFHNRLNGSIPEGLYDLTGFKSIDLDRNRLTGSISERIGNLALLEAFVVSNNRMTGTLPKTMQHLTHMTNLELQVNFLNGTIPNELYYLNKMVKFNVAANGLSGTLSKSVSNFSHAVFLSYADNFFHGRIPSELWRCTLLSNLYLSANYLSGPISDSLSTLTRLSEVYLDINELTGPMPKGLGNLTTLQVLDLGINDLRGPIEPGVYSLRRLIALALSNNSLTGTISKDISGFGAPLQLLDFGFNQLRGTVPETIGQLFNVEALSLAGNGFEGRIPASIGNMTSLRSLALAGNAFTGNIPPTIGLITSLQSFEANNNALNGTIPDQFYYNYNLSTLLLNNNRLSGSLSSRVGNLTQLTNIEINNNFLTGPLPSSIGSLVKLVSLNFYSNGFTGTLSTKLCQMPLLTVLYFQNNFLHGPVDDCFFHMKGLTELVLYNNSLSGTIAKNLSSATLTNVLLYDNQLTGPLPSEITSTSLLYLELNGNDLTGRIAPDTFSASKSLKQLSFQSNHLTDSIPSSLGSLASLQYLDLSTNALTGSLPAPLSALGLLEKFFVNQNSLTGSVVCFNSSHQQYLTNVELSNNQFTGTLPEQMFQIDSLQTFAAVSNCFSGSIPPSICSAQSLTALALDGLHTASSCRIDLVPFKFSNSYALNYFVPGSIPSCLFNMTVLDTLHVTGNGIRGSIEPSVTMSRPLTDLALSYNQLTGLIPDAVTFKSYYNLDLSYNKLTGILPDDLVPAPANGSLYLQVNRMSGDVPGSLRYANTIQILDGNLFTCDYLRKSLPRNDPEYVFYECGTSDMQQAIYAWIIATGLLLTVLAAILLVHRFYGLSSFGETSPVIQWCRAYYANMARWREMFHNKDKNYSLSNVRLFGKFCTSLRRSFLLITVFVIVVVLPISTAVSHYYSMYQYQYGWAVSSVLCTGVAPGMIFLVMFIAFLGWLFWVFYRNLVNYRTVKLVDQASRFTRTSRMTDVHSPDSFRLTGGGSFRHSSWRHSTSEAGDAGELEAPEDVARNTQGSLSLASGESDTIAVSASEANTYGGKSNKNVTASGQNWKHYLCLAAVALFNFVVVLIVNVNYVVITTRYSPAIVVVTQVCVAAFKLLWNDFAIRGLTILAHNYSTKAVSLSAAAERALEGKYMSFNTYTLIFNIIVIPCLATAAVSSDCFYDVLFPSDDIVSSYSYTTCTTLETIVQLKHNNCTSFEEVTTTTSYFPPFVYRYQCASTLVTTYAVLYVYNFIIAAFGQPLLMILLGWLCKFLNPDSSLFLLIQNIIPKLYRQSARVFTDKSRIFFKDRFNLRMTMYLSVFVTFGVIFPPLAVIICVAVWAQSYFTQLSIGKQLDGLTIESENDLKVLQIFDYDCANCGDIFKQSIVYVGPVAALFYGFLVFDTYGDVVGAAVASWAPIVLFVIGCIISVVYVVAVKKEPLKSVKEPRSRSSEMVSRKQISEITFSKSMGLKDSESSTRPGSVRYTDASAAGGNPAIKLTVKSGPSSAQAVENATVHNEITSQGDISADVVDVVHVVNPIHGSGGSGVEAEGTDSAA